MWSARKVTVEFLIDAYALDWFMREMETAARHGEGVTLQTAGGQFWLDVERAEA